MALRGPQVEDNAIFASRTGIEEFYTLRHDNDEEDLCDEETTFVIDWYDDSEKEMNVDSIWFVNTKQVSEHATTDAILPLATLLKTVMKDNVMVGKVVGKSKGVADLYYSSVCHTLLVIPTTVLLSNYEWTSVLLQNKMLLLQSSYNIYCIDTSNVIVEEEASSPVSSMLLYELSSSQRTKNDRGIKTLPVPNILCNDVASSVMTYCKVHNDDCRRSATLYTCAGTSRHTSLKELYRIFKPVLEEYATKSYDSSDDTAVLNELQKSEKNMRNSDINNMYL